MYTVNIRKMQRERRGHVRVGKVRGGGAVRQSVRLSSLGRSRADVFGQALAMAAAMLFRGSARGR